MYVKFATMAPLENLPLPLEEFAVQMSAFAFVIDPSIDPCRHSARRPEKLSTGARSGHHASCTPLEPRLYTATIREILKVSPRERSWVVRH